MGYQIKMILILLSLVFVCNANAFTNKSTKKAMEVVLKSEFLKPLMENDEHSCGVFASITLEGQETQPIDAMTRDFRGRLIMKVAFTRGGETNECEFFALVDDSKWTVSWAKESIEKLASRSAR
jgi:hypothetical protein